MSHDTKGPAPEPRLGISGRIAAAFQSNAITPLLALVALLVGLFAVLVTPREEEPQINVTMANVIVPFPGASARQVESQVATPMERVLAEARLVAHRLREHPEVARVDPDRPELRIAGRNGLALGVAALGLVVNLLSAWMLHGRGADPHHGQAAHGHGHDHRRPLRHRGGAGTRGGAAQLPAGSAAPGCSTAPRSSPAGPPATALRASPSSFQCPINPSAANSGPARSLRPCFISRKSFSSMTRSCWKSFIPKQAIVGVKMTSPE